MRVLLDECLPRQLAREFSGHVISTVPQQGWAGLSNGALLAKIGASFDVFVTVDSNLPAQQTVTRLAFGVIVLRARTNRLADLQPLAPAIAAALGTIQPGQVVTVG